MRTILGPLRAALSLLVLRRPRLPAAPVSSAAFWLALLLVGAMGALDDWWMTQAPRLVSPDGLRGLAFHALLALALGVLIARGFLERPRLAWHLAALLLLLTTFTWYVLRPIELAPIANRFAAIDPDRVEAIALAIWTLWIGLALLRAFGWLEPAKGFAARGLVALLCAATLTLPRQPIPIGHLVATAAPVDVPETTGADDDGESDADEGEDSEPAEEPPSFDVERVMAAQPKLVADQLARLSPQRPGQVDLYLVGFGGDGDEDVFRNEVEYAEKLFAQRFEAAGRTLVLLNHEETTAQRPLATRSNLRDALAGLAHVIDPDEDVVMLFLTSHGSPDHALYVKLGPLALYDVTPADIKASLDEAGIRHRVVVVSACYAGGFIPALADAHTMVIAAARADRSSFGCGSEADITWFGRAFLVDALNRTDDFGAAFAQARDEIERWEGEQKRERSYPEMATAPEIDRHLELWRKQLHSGFPVPFRAPPAKGGTELVP